MTWEQGRATIEQLLHRGELETVVAEEAVRAARLVLPHLSRF